mgnify:CR=1 FL=1
MDFNWYPTIAPTGDSARSDRTAIGLDPARLRSTTTLLGVTGSGKTFTVANVISQLNRPTLVLSHNKTSRHSSTGSSRTFSRKMRSNTSFPTTTIISRSLPTFDGYLYRKGPFDQRRNRKMRLSTTATLLSGRRGRHRRFQRIVSVRLRQSERFPLDGHSYRSRRNPQLQAVPLQTGRSALYPDRTGTDPRDIPRDGRHDRHHGGFRRIRQPVFPRHLFDNEVESIQSIDPVTGQRI